MATVPVAQKADTPSYGATVSTFPEEKTEELESRVFPFDIFCFLPEPLKFWIPLPLRKIVSLPHLVVFLALLSSIAVLADTVLRLHHGGCRTSHCIGDPWPLVFVAFCTFYFLRTLQQYDAVLEHKQRELSAARRDLDQRCQEMIHDLEGYLSKSIETEVLLAERGFESHRRDFGHFLDRYAKRLGETDASGMLMLAFRSFVGRWLAFFSECSVDPSEHPLIVAAPDVIDACKNTGEIIQVVSERLQNTEVQFITRQREQDNQEITNVRSAWANKVSVQKKAHAFFESMIGRVPVFHKKADADVDPEAGTTLSFDGNMATGEPFVDTYRWVRWGQSESLGMKHEDAPQVAEWFPIELRMGCVTVIMLSADHIRLILAFFIGVGVLIYEAVAHIDGHSHAHYTVVAEMSVCLICILFILYEFLDMDIIAQLDGQLRELEAEQAKALQNRERIMSFYTSAQELGDFWLHHTLPELELMKNFFENLQGIPVGEHPELMNTMDSELEALGKSAPAIQLWRGNNSIDLKQKKSYDNLIMEVVNKSKNNKEMLAMMPQCSRDVRVLFGLDSAADHPPLAIAADGRAKEIVVGMAVEYMSTSLGRWIPALVQHIDPCTGLIDLDCRKQVERSKVRFPQPVEERKGGCNQQ